MTSSCSSSMLRSRPPGRPSSWARVWRPPRTPRTASAARPSSGSSWWPWTHPGPCRRSSPCASRGSASEESPRLPEDCWVGGVACCGTSRTLSRQCWSERFHSRSLCWRLPFLVCCHTERLAALRSGYFVCPKFDFHHLLACCFFWTVSVTAVCEWCFGACVFHRLTLAFQTTVGRLWYSSLGIQLYADTHSLAVWCSGTLRVNDFPLCVIKVNCVIIGILF